MCQNCEGMGLHDFITKELKINRGSCLLNNTANPAQFRWKWAGLAVLFIRQLPNSSHDFFQTFSIYNISAIGGVHRVSETDRPSESKEGENNYGNNGILLP